MLTVIGLGSAGCNIAEMFEGVENINVLLIDSQIEGDNCFSLPNFNNPEDYENNLPNLDKFLIACQQKVLFIVSGCGKVSGATLKILSTIKGKEITILYIRPDTDTLTGTSKLQDRLVFNVLQEYSRSGLFKQIFLISNLEIEAMIGDIPVIGYYETLNKVIYNILFKIINKQETIVFENFSPPKEISRIATFGIYDLENNIEKIFYKLVNIDDRCYHFVINENKLKTDGKLFKLIKDRMKEKSVDNEKISYIIHSTNQEHSYCYLTVHSRKIQE